MKNRYSHGRENDLLATIEEVTALKDIASFPIGVAVSYYLARNDAAYGSIINTHFNRVTFEYQMKHEANVRNDGSFDFTDSDILVGKALAAGIDVFGHTLVWHRDNNNYYLRSLDPKHIDTAMQRWIEASMTRYAGKVRAWDVVNEPFTETGKLRTSFSNNWFFSWYDALGGAYISNAFRYAHAADPTALLFINEYNLELNETKLNGLLRLIDELKRQNVPLHGIGTQMHIYIDTSNECIDKMFIRLAATGLQVHVSELDVRMNPGILRPFVPLNELFEQQADRFAYVVESYRRHVPSSQQYGITIWNVSDRDSWVNLRPELDDYPTLFDRNYNKKPAFSKFLSALR